MRKLLSALLFFAPLQAQACAVCFGDSKSDLGRAFTWGIFILLGFTFLILAGLAAMIHRIESHRQD